jgi:hypothetical protein
MSVTVDDQPLPAEQMGLETFGQVLSHIQKDKRLIVHVLLDGQEPDVNDLGTLKASPIKGHTIFIETAEPRKMALDVLDQVDQQLAESDRLTADAVGYLRDNQNLKAMEKLRGCFGMWQHAQESLIKVAQLLRIDLSRVIVDGRPFVTVLGEFAAQLKLIRGALENRDFVSLTDTLVYEMGDTTANWRAAVQSIRSTLG